MCCIFFGFRLELGIFSFEFSRYLFNSTVWYGSMKPSLAIQISLPSTNFTLYLIPVGHFLWFIIAKIFSDFSCSIFLLFRILFVDADDFSLLLEVVFLVRWMCFFNLLCLTYLEKYPAPTFTFTLSLEHQLWFSLSVSVQWKRISPLGLNLWFLSSLEMVCHWPY